MTNHEAEILSDDLISILVYSYSGKLLSRCVHDLFDQDDLKNIEVVICDDASTDGAWEAAVACAKRFEGRVTLSRNAKAIGRIQNRKKGRYLVKGQFCVELSESDRFDPAYVAAVVRQLKKDESMEHAYIHRLTPFNPFLPPSIDRTKNNAVSGSFEAPRVSVFIYNFNYGCFLRQCFESVFAQTYHNVEVCFSDNASTDESWEIALEYAKRYPGRISLTRNRINFGPAANLANCQLDCTGDYILKLCSDDALDPSCLEKCVSALETFPQAIFAIVHRDILTDTGERIHEPPFYNQSCLIPGNEQAAVYMMSSVTPSVSQIVYRRRMIDGKRMAGNLNDRWFGDRIQDFLCCCDAPIVYLDEPLLLNRVHSGNDSATLNKNLLQCLGEYVLLHQLADIATHYPHMQKASSRLNPGLEKLASLCLRYSVRSVLEKDERTALRYLNLARAIVPEIERERSFELLSAYLCEPGSDQQKIYELLERDASIVQRRVSYPPPPGSVEIAKTPEPVLDCACE